MEGMDAKVVNILKDKVASEWKIFARGTGFNDVDVVVEQIDHDVDIDQKGHDNLTRDKSKIEFFLKKLYQQHPTDYRTCIQNSLKVMGRKDVLLDLTLLDAEQHKDEMREALKNHYLKTYGKMDEFVHIARTPAKVELLNKFIELTVVDADEVEKDTVSIAERELFLKRQMTYKPIKFDEVFSEKFSLLLISGIAGIGKTCLLRKCLLDWANGILWQTVDFVLYFECRKLNQFQNIGNINELLNVFYKDIFQECNVCEHFSILFMIDGLDEFAHLDKLIKHNLLNPSKDYIINALAEALNIQKYKCVVAGRVGAISQYKYKVRECTDKLTIQIMGLNDKGVNKYIESYGNKKETIKSVLNESFYAKAMASVPFYLSAMCAVIVASGSYSFNTMTELYCSIFLYFFQNHICKTDETVYIMMQSESNKQHVLRVCKVAWELFNQDKILFSQDEMKGIINDFDEVENKLLGFIERVDSQLGYQYQFAHLTLMEFCASVHAHIYLSPEEIISNKKLLSCLPMICGLANENKRSFVRLLGNLKNSNEEKNILLNAVLDSNFGHEAFKQYAEYLLPNELTFDSMGNTWQVKANYEQLHNDTSTSSASYLNAKVKNVLIKKQIGKDWKKFARLTDCSDKVNAIVDQIDHDVTGGDEPKVERFLTKLVELHPNDYINYVQKSLKAMGRNDLHQCIASICAEQQKI